MLFSVICFNTQAGVIGNIRDMVYTAVTVAWGIAVIVTAIEAIYEKDINCFYFTVTMYQCAGTCLFFVKYKDGEEKEINVCEKITEVLNKEYPETNKDACFTFKNAKISIDKNIFYESEEKNIRILTIVLFSKQLIINCKYLCVKSMKTTYSALFRIIPHYSALF